MNIYTWAILAWVTSIVAFVLAAAYVWFLRRRGERPPAVRAVPAFGDLEIKVKQAAESGKAIHIALGSGRLAGEQAITSLVGIQVVEALADHIVAYDIPAVISVGDPTLLPLVQDVLRRAYERRDLIQLYDPTSVRFIAPDPVAYAAGAGTVTMTEEAMANVIVGHFGSEASLVADAGARLDVFQSGGLASPSGIAALYPVTDHLAIGEEVFTAGAQMTGKDRHLVSLLAQDILRLIVIGTILLLTALALLQSVGMG